MGGRGWAWEGVGGRGRACGCVEGGRVVGGGGGVMGGWVGGVAWARGWACLVWWVLVCVVCVWMDVDWRVSGWLVFGGWV
jgi:hypothetical protein